MRKIAIAVAVLFALTGCGNMTTTDGEQSVNNEVAYNLKDGRVVTCIAGRARLSCDWENAK